MVSVKLPFTYQEQIEKIKQKGCFVEDDNYCLEVLQNIGYYRLSAYFLPFKKDQQTNIEFNFNNVCRLYEFDRELRNLLFETIEVVEVKARTVFAHYFAFHYGALGYENDEVFNNYFDREKFDEIIQKQIENTETDYS